MKYHEKELFKTHNFVGGGEVILLIIYTIFSNFYFKKFWLWKSGFEKLSQFGGGGVTFASSPSFALWPGKSSQIQPMKSEFRFPTSKIWQHCLATLIADLIVQLWKYVHKIWRDNFVLAYFAGDF